MKTIQGEMEIQAQLFEVVERNSISAEQRAVQEEEEYTLFNMELELAKNMYNNEKEKTKVLEKEEKEVRDAISNLQIIERKMAKEGKFFFFLTFSHNT
jgi:DNA polymerase III delta prime subunit